MGGLVTQGVSGRRSSKMKWEKGEGQKIQKNSGPLLENLIEGNVPTRCQWLELIKMKDASQQEDR